MSLTVGSALRHARVGLGTHFTHHARVGERAKLILLIKENTCDEAAQWPHASITGPDGKYRREFIFGSMIWTPDKVFLLCVSHPDHEPYEYRMVYEKTPRTEKNGTRFLNFYLRKKSAAEPKGRKC